MTARPANLPPPGYCRPYRPDPSLIEHVFAKLKPRLRKDAE